MSIPKFTAEASIAKTGSYGHMTVGKHKNNSDTLKIEPAVRKGGERCVLDDCTEKYRDLAGGSFYHCTTKFCSFGFFYEDGSDAGYGSETYRGDWWFYIK